MSTTARPAGYTGTHRRPAEATPTLRGASLREWAADTVAVLRRTFDPTPAPPTVDAHTDIPHSDTSRGVRPRPTGTTPR